MTDKDKEEIANLVIKKLLNTRTQLSRDLDKMDDILSEVLGAQLTEEETLIGELAKLMTLMNIYENNEEFERAAVVKTRVDKINNRIDEIEEGRQG